MSSSKAKKVLVTGSTRGLGLHIAKTFEKYGCQVVRNGHKKRPLDLGGMIWGDVTKADDAKIVVEAALEQLGHLDTVVCNVGSGVSVPPGQENLEHWKNMFDKNFFATTNIVEAAREHLKKTKGSIICISSICGLEVVQSAPTTYSVSKAALNFYVKSISKVLALDDVRINAIAPGNLFFEGSVWEKKHKENAEAVDTMLKSDVPLRRFGQLNEISELAVWLASHHAGFTTGSIFVVDGGQTRAI